MILFVLIVHPVYYLALLETSMSYCCKTRIPVVEAILAAYLFLVLRLIYLCKINSVSLGIIGDELLEGYSPL